MKQLLVALMLLSAFPAAAHAQLGERLKKLGRVGASAVSITPAQEIEIGKVIAATVAGRYPVLQDEALTRYVNLVGAAVAMQSPRRAEIEFRFGVLDTEDVNAFASPGGYIWITRGALELIESEAELAGVLAHEVAHVDEKHVLEEIRRGDVLTSAREEMELDGAVLDRVAGLGASVLFTGLGRTEELEADSLGAVYAAASGYHNGGLRRFVARLGDQQQGRLAELRSSHPPASDRLEALDRQHARAGGVERGADPRERYQRVVRRGG